MIRKFNQSDIEEVINIWLECSYISHDFINRDFWNSQIEDMKKIYIPASETYIFEENEKIIGFISYYEWAIAAIFVNHKYQWKGIWKQLLNFIKNKYSELKLTVYSQNKKSVEFYSSQWFKIIKEQKCSFTENNEFVMTWLK